MKLRNLLLTFGAAVLVTGLSACSEDEPFDPSSVNLGSSQNEIYVSAAAGTYDLEVYTNASYHVELVDETVDWLAFSAGEPTDGRAIVGIKYDTNEGFSRMASFALLSDVNADRCDTVWVLQRAGQDPILRFDESSIQTLEGGGGEAEIVVATNIPIDEMDVVIEYADEGIEEWITDLRIEGSGDERTLVVVYDANTAGTPRSATLRFSFTDGWGTTVSASISLLQANKDGGLFTTISFEELRNMYATGEKITDYIGIDGIVVSNKDEGNAGCPVQTAYDTIDWSAITNTIYFESEDAQYGIVIYVDDEEDNVFDQFDRVTLMLQGATLTRKFEDRENCPTRYELTDFDPNTMVFNREAGESAPVKDRTIATLTDDDMFTYVRLTDVQFPVRKGSFFPAEGGTQLSANANKTTKAPTLVVDKEGNDLYMLMNNKCTYHADGTRPPFGQGNLYGVIVHEHYARFVWENGYHFWSDIEAEEDHESLGNIGKYQIRTQTRDDIWGGELSDAFGNGSIKMLTEYRYRHIRYIGDDDALKDMGDSLDFPSYGSNGWLTHTYQTKYTGTSSKNYTGNSDHINNVTSYDYLGPLGSSASGFYGKNVGNVNGIAVVIDENDNTTSRPGRFATGNDGKMELGSQYAKNTSCGYGAGGWADAYASTGGGTIGVDVINDASSSSNAGKGRTPGGSRVSWCNGYWWDADTGTPYGFLVNVSTGSVSASVAFMQIRMCAYESGGYTPRYWTVEWTDVDPVPDAGAEWTSIGTFVLSDWLMYNSSETRCYPSNMPKTVNFKCTEILGKGDVYIRIRPTNDKCSAGYADGNRGYDDAQLKSGSHQVILSYFAIRYAE